MNCPLRTEPEFPEGYNQNPNELNADATTRADLGFMMNTRARDDHRLDCHSTDDDTAIQQRQADEAEQGLQFRASGGLHRRLDAAKKSDDGSPETATRPSACSHEDQDVVHPERREGILGGAINVVRKYLKFVGPGFMVAVAYIDPGRFLTSLIANVIDGADRYRKLCYRRCCWCIIPIQIALHCTYVQHLRDFPTEPMHQIGNCDWHGSCSKLQGAFATVVELFALLLRRISHHCNRYRRGKISFNADIPKLT
jgi:hypothetical protein